MDDQALVNKSSRTHRRKFFRLAVIASLFVFTGILLVGLSVPQVRWRLQLTAMFVSGQIPDIEAAEFFRYLSPSSSQSLARLIETKDPYPVIRNPAVSQASLIAGAKRYTNQCATCHSSTGAGSVSAPALTNRTYSHGESDWAIFRTIRYGIKNTAMAAHPLQESEIWELAAYVRSLKSDVNEADTKPAIQLAGKMTDLEYADLEATKNSESDWLTYSGSYNGMRHSDLQEINHENIADLNVSWVRQFEGISNFIETSPIVRAGVMFATLPGDRVVALNAGNGEVLWDKRYATEAKGSVTQFSGINRGVALMGKTIFLGTSSAHLVAISAVNGDVIWEKEVGDPKGFYISGAPLAYRDLVVTGVGTKGGQRGFVVAYDIKTGVERWRFVAIPGPGDTANKTWEGNSWQEGGAPTWLTGAYDPVSDRLFWGIGNPKPDYDAASRRGDNLYSNSIVALNGSTGKLAWHFQFTPADDHDWDSNQIPMLVDRKFNGHVEKQVVFANRNGFYYVLDRDSGKFISASAYVKQNWTDGISSNGRPIPAKAVQGNQKGTVIYPGNTGGTNWWSPSIDPDLDIAFIPVLEQGMVYFPSADPGQTEQATKASWPTGTGRSLYTAVRALDARTGKQIWEHKQAPRIGDNVAGGLLSTRTGLLFGSDRSKFFALNSRTGVKMWEFQTGGKINAAPVTYNASGKQFVAIATGNSLFSFHVPEAVSRNISKNDIASR